MHINISVYTLYLDRGRYYRVKENQTAGEIERQLLTPVNVSVYAGAVIMLCDSKVMLYSVQAGESYLSVAEKFRVNEDELKELNGGRAVYPTAKIFVPVLADES